MNEELVQTCRDTITELLKEGSRSGPRSEEDAVPGVFQVDWVELRHVNPDLAEDCLESPVVIEYLETAVDGLSESNQWPSGLTVRLANLGEARTMGINDCSPSHINTVVSVRGQVSQVTQEQPRLIKGIYECQRCGTPIAIPQSKVSNRVRTPTECIGCERKGPFELVSGDSDFIAAKMLRLQCPPEDAQADAHLDVALYEDQAQHELSGGERVVVTGRLSIREDELDNPEFPYILQADSVRIEQGVNVDIDREQYAEEIEAIRNSGDPISLLKDSIAPNIHRNEALETAIEAIVLQMAGTYPRGPFRGDSHVLLLGDPGKAKSVILEDVEKKAPLSRLKSGRGVSGPGLTAAVVSDDFGAESRSLKAGLLVLTNGGIACLDEIDKVPDAALTGTHSALESQRVSISKWGIDADLPAQSALLAAGNPKYGRFDQYEPISQQIDFEPSLLSRFDLIFTLVDRPDTKWDRNVANHVGESWSSNGAQVADCEEDSVSDEDNPGIIPNDVFAAYLASVKNEVYPVIEDQEVKDYAAEEYVKLRSRGACEDSPVPITARKLEAIYRLAEASARARWSSVVEQEDIERSLRLHRRSLQDIGVDPETGEFDADLVETGQPKRERDQIKAIREIITEHQGDGDNGAPETAVLSSADEEGISLENTMERIEYLISEGDAYRVGENELRLAN